jgi:hypothetical protein
MQQDLTNARALRDRMHRAMRACATDLAQVGARLDEALEALRAKYPTTTTPGGPAL